MRSPDREDLGVDLHAPAEREEGGDYWSYSFVREVREGDVILHYRARPNNAITHWSRAVGEAYADEVYWGAHGQAGGRGPLLLTGAPDGGTRWMGRISCRRP